MNKHYVIAMTMALFCLTSGASFAGKPQGRPPGPPPEAIAACEGKEVGEAVSFKGRHGETLEASCKTIKGQLVAVPANRPDRGNRPE